MSTEIDTERNCLKQYTFVIFFFLMLATGEKWCPSNGSTELELLQPNTMILLVVISKLLNWNLQ